MGNANGEKITVYQLTLCMLPLIINPNMVSILRPTERLERQAEFHYSDKTRPDSPVPTLQGPCDLSQKWRGTQIGRAHV